MLSPPVTFFISIHTLLAECDLIPRYARKRAVISIHTLLAECDHALETSVGKVSAFQSTHSLRSATSQYSFKVEIYEFQSTHSLRSATGFPSAHSKNSAISIHTLLAECDLANLFNIIGKIDFNPHTPCGVRPYILHIESQQPQEVDIYKKSL